MIYFSIYQMYNNCYSLARVWAACGRSVDASTLSQKFAHLNNSILKKKSSACRSDAVLRKYYDTLPRTIRFRQLFNDENRNRFYLELGKTDHCYRDCFMATPSLPLEFTGGGHLCHSDLCFVVKSVPHQINVLCDFCEHIQKIS